MKFNIIDGKNTARVTFWDAFVELFEDVLKEDFEKSLIIIISAVG